MHSYKLTRWGCYIAFSLFSFTYLYSYQGGILAALQHVLSEGVTTYDNLIGGVLITIFLVILTFLINRVSVIRDGLPAMGFLPAFIVLALLTNVNSSVSCIYDFHPLLLILIPIVIAWAVLSFSKKSILSYLDLRNHSFLSQSFWVNIMLMVFMMVCTGLAANGNDLFHYRMKMEQELKSGNYDISEYSDYEYDRTDTVDVKNVCNITMLHAHALAKQQLMGDELFSYTVAGTSNDLLPLYNSRSSCIVFPKDSIFSLIGAKPGVPMTTAEYLCIMSKQPNHSRVVGDYLLCGSLIDRDLNRFAKLLPEYYEVNDSLPRHYKEALLLHNHLNGSSSESFANDSLMNCLTEVMALAETNKEEPIGLLKAKLEYRPTYWYYFFF